MNSQSEYDIEKQFLADLEKAKALSLEQLELDRLRQKKRFQNADQNINTSSQSEITTKQLTEYQNYLKKRIQSSQSFSNETTAADGQIPSLPQPTANNKQSRRHSEIRNPFSEQQSQTDSVDLMSFTAPPQSTAQQTNNDIEAHKSFVQMVDEMHKLNSQLQNEPLSVKVQRSQSVSSSPLPYGFIPSLYSSPPAAPVNTNMQLVPYNNQQNKPTPLTPTELNRLYNINNQYQPRTSGSFVPPIIQHQPPNTLPFVPTIQQTAAGFLSHPQQPIYQQKQQPNYLPPQLYSQYSSTNIPSTSSSIVNQEFPSIVPKLPPKQQLPIPPEIPKINPIRLSSSAQVLSSAANTETSASSAASTSSVVLRRKSENNKPNDDLIDLGNGLEDNSRVSVLEAFDPLIIGNRSSSDDDKGDNASSYYSEYDQFDYIYSGGTQFSDPVYEAINRTDKTPLSPNSCSSGSGPPGIGWNIPPCSPPPPPLPPRNSNNSNSSYCGASSNINNCSNHSNDNSLMIDENYKNNMLLDRRKISSKLYENVIVRKNYDKELIAFYNMVKQLRSEYKYDDSFTNIGHVVAAEFDYFYSVGTSIKLLVHPALDCFDTNLQKNNKGQIEGYGPPIPFTCDITTTVEHVIMHVFCALEGQIINSVNDFILKSIGKHEILKPTSKLNQLECIHNSIKLEHDVQLSICPRNEKIIKMLARTYQDDLRDADIKIEDILPNEPTYSINYDNVMILLETLETEIEKLESSASDNNPHTIITCSGVVQAVKAICQLLGTIDTFEITEAIAELKNACQHGQTIYSMKDSAATYNSGSLDIVSESGDYAEVTLRPRTTGEQIRFRCNQVRNSIQTLLEIYSQAFRVNFCVNVPDWNLNPISILEISQPTMVNIMCLHRPPVTWHYDDYLLGAQIYHGTRYIGDAVVTQCSNEISGIYPRFKFDSWISFRNIPVCTLPRESRLIFVLYGCTTEPIDGTTTTNNEDSTANTSNQTTNHEGGRITKVELGWTSIQFFDFERKMIQGSYLLSLWPPTSDKYFGPAPAKGTHPYGDIYPVLSINIPDYGGTPYFPEPLKNVPAARFLDFNSLDKNLQQELIDTAEQGYPLDKLDKREVLWEKRYYLHSLPYALPKILHAAHSWDFLCLSDLHTLLKSWSTLTPLQALELLLPRYPDLEVRVQAVKWISKMSNDQLVDFLPQLLQALKHDTYEGSPLAFLLLGRSLESPRIAHSLYWLLIHSLPGDTPQNMSPLDNQSVDDSFVNQSRYHRRNQLMLRALLAICGEKLSSRFLSQNIMCKTLGDAAQSVKLAKESHRLQILKQHLESVNQSLRECPTSLPLGPALEVSGISVKNCNYFNSNTLPLKISYMGPDKQLLPAIFKSGDDLQQDMLVLQMVKLMDKLWLKEGLDLKMVTFDCVSTGYKKGMIELVTDAETLRKIQVEWGLTGSFKDKSIAEWLAKQNPNQLEYQRAVDNFTVSCAGYSVATYILGICDRHNDNIMLKTSGHLFHIDFGKFLGDAQMFGNFKRDRTPFVLTSDMAYVINGGDRPSIKFHYFVDLCCTAFNIVRKHSDLILHMFALMTNSGIPGVTAEAVNYVRNALLPGQSNPEAAASFAKMIHISLKSWFTQFNFFLHNIAQMKFTNENDDGELLSFVPRAYTMAQDGRLKSVIVHGYQKRYDLEKYYTYILKVTRQSLTVPVYLFRSYKEFCEFHQKLCLHFPLAKLHSLPSLHVGRSNIKTVAERRLPEIRQFLISLFNSADEIAHSDLVYTFFHPLLRDQQEADISLRKVKSVRQSDDSQQPTGGEVKLSFQYHRGAFIVMIHHARSLPMLTNSQEPNTYVKVYLKPDRSKVTKRKTKVVRKNCNPSFMETLEYRLPLEFINTKLLHVTVWSHDTLQENEFLGGFEINLNEIDLKIENIQWYKLCYLPRS
uniref:Putative phosphotidylinositol 3 kinase 68d n=1 Tax=Corethrella appendiculata TaxID=1370023 RepID=W4VRG7_9DIPT